MSIIHIHILEGAAHPSAMETITIIPKHKIIEIESEKELLGHLFSHSINSRPLFISSQHSPRLEAVVYSQVFSQMTIQ